MLRPQRGLTGPTRLGCGHLLSRYYWVERLKTRSFRATGVTHPVLQTQRTIVAGTEHTRLGRSGLQVPCLALGCMTCGDPGQGMHSWCLDEDAS